MIIYLKNSEIKRDLWDACLRSSQIRKPYAYSWYLDIMSPGWEALVDDDYDSVFPVPGFRKYGIQYITTPIFLQQLGAYSPDKPIMEVVHEFIDYMPEFYRFIDLCVGQKITNPGYTVTERSNYELNLRSTYEIIWSKFSSDCRRNIQLASKKEPDITTRISPDEIIDLFIRNRGSRLKGIKPRDYERLNNLMHYCINNKMGRIAGIRTTRKKLVFAIFIVEIPGSKTILLTANTAESRKIRAGYYVVNDIIRDNTQKDTILDFAGSSIPSVASFMESFGCENNPYYRIYRNLLPWPVRLFK